MTSPPKTNRTSSRVARAHGQVGVELQADEIGDGKVDRGRLLLATWPDGRLSGQATLARLLPSGLSRFQLSLRRP